MPSTTLGRSSRRKHGERVIFFGSPAYAPNSSYHFAATVLLDQHCVKTFAPPAIDRPLALPMKAKTLPLKATQNQPGFPAQHAVFG
jgi:hypothetical protein